jgi:DNA-binding SARP family transcriptional activator
MDCEITLTGLVTVHGHDGVRRHLPSAQTRLALARLTLDRERGTTRDELADALWPRQLPSTWAPALRSIVSRVRALVAVSLSHDVNPLVWRDGRYLLLLPHDVAVDVEMAEQAILTAQAALESDDLGRALGLATDGVRRLERGFLPECDGGWVDEVRERYDHLVVVGCETASAAATALGDTTGALAFASQAIRRAPLRESAHRCHMAAHMRAGNRAEALRSYERIRRVLAEELGVDPAPETEAAYLDLLGSPLA